MSGGGGGCDGGGHVINGGGSDGGGVTGAPEVSTQPLPEWRTTINGAPVTEQSHEYVIRIPKPDAEN